MSEPSKKRKIISFIPNDVLLALQNVPSDQQATCLVQDNDTFEINVESISQTISATFSPILDTSHEKHERMSLGKEIDIPSDVVWFTTTSTTTNKRNTSSRTKVCTSVSQGTSIIRSTSSSSKGVVASPSTAVASPSKGVVASPSTAVASPSKGVASSETGISLPVRAIVASSASSAVTGATSLSAHVSLFSSMTTVTTATASQLPNKRHVTTQNYAQPTRNQDTSYNTDTDREISQLLDQVSTKQIYSARRNKLVQPVVHQSAPDSSTMSMKDPGTHESVSKNNNSKKQESVNSVSHAKTADRAKPSPRRTAATKQVVSGTTSTTFTTAPYEAKSTKLNAVGQICDQIATCIVNAPSIPPAGTGSAFLDPATLRGIQSFDTYFGVTFVAPTTQEESEALTKFLNTTAEMYGQLRRATQTLLNRITHIETWQQSLQSLTAQLQWLLADRNVKTDASNALNVQNAAMRKMQQSQRYLDAASKDLNFATKKLGELFSCFEQLHHILRMSSITALQYDAAGVSDLLL